MPPENPNDPHRDLRPELGLPKLNFNFSARQIVWALVAFFAVTFVLYLGILNPQSGAVMDHFFGLK